MTIRRRYDARDGVPRLRPDPSATSGRAGARWRQGRAPRSFEPGANRVGLVRRTGRRADVSTRCLAAITLLLVLVTAGRAAAQAPPETPRDTVHLAVLRTEAVRGDPRAAQPELLTRAARHRIAAIRAEGLPRFALTGRATVQSDVPSIPIRTPGGAVPAPPEEQAQAQIEVEWSVYDGGRKERQTAVERARLRENIAGVGATLYTLRTATTETYFGVLLREAQARALALAAADLAARLELLRRRAAEGAALEADAAAVEAELIRVRQRVDEAEASRRAALAVLADLTGRPLGDDAVLTLPDLSEASARAEVLLRALDGADAARLAEITARPEFARLAATARRAEAEARLARVAQRPAVSLFGQAGVGRPSPFDFLSDELSDYALAGVRLRWAPWDWGAARHRAAAARLQADIARAEAAALAYGLSREVEDERAAIERLEAALPQDRRAVALREEALRVARRRLEEGTILPDVYTDRVTDLAEARLALERHRIELAHARASLLSTLGAFPEAADGR